MSYEKKSFKKGYKFPFFPTDLQKKLIENTFGCCRFVWNKALDEIKQEYEQYLEFKNSNILNKPKKPDVSGYSFVKKLTFYKNDKTLYWLNDVNAVSLQQTMLHLGGAFNRFFKTNKGYPNFKKKTSKQSFSLMRTAFRFKDDGFYIPKSKEPLKIKFTRALPSEPSSCVISKTASGKYYISFICEYQPLKTNGTGSIGIDLGIKDFITISTGEKVSNPKYLSVGQKRLKKLQQSLMRKQKGSRNRNKTRILLAKQHEYVTNARKDFHHKLSRRLVNENQVIGLEKLIVKNLIRNRKLSKQISDAGWSNFTQMLEYKTIESQHNTLVYMDTFYPSSHLCNNTKRKLDFKLKLNEREWKCPYCGQVHDRDVNAALNIKDEAVNEVNITGIDKCQGKIILSLSRY